MHGQEFFRSVAGHAPFSQWPPSVVRFFRDYLRHEKTVEFAGRRMINTHFPPWPSAAFDRMARRMGELGRSAGEGGGLYSVTLAVTNRGGATAADVATFARGIRDGVRDAFGVTLVNEPVLVGHRL